MAMDLTTMTPAEIDTELARISQLQQQMQMHLASSKKHRASYEAQGRVSMLTQIEKHITEYQDKLNQLDAEAAPYEAEFVRRGGWLRYFLVQNAGGHIHRGMNCSTCFFDTRYNWLIDLADCDEAAMVEQYGETACTICFPNAPTFPGWARSVEEREAAEAAKTASKCPTSGQYAPATAEVNGSFRLYRAWGRCPECGEGVSITSTGKFRSHKKAVAA